MCLHVFFTFGFISFKQSELFFFVIFVTALGIQKYLYCLPISYLCYRTFPLLKRIVGSLTFVRISYYIVLNLLWVIGITTKLNSNRVHLIDSCVPRTCRQILNSELSMQKQLKLNIIVMNHKN